MRPRRHPVSAARPPGHPFAGKNGRHGCRAPRPDRDAVAEVRDVGRGPPHRHLPVGRRGLRRTVLCVHGFASSCRDNWVNTGWVRDLTRAGLPRARRRPARSRRERQAARRRRVRHGRARRATSSPCSTRTCSTACATPATRSARGSAGSSRCRRPSTSSGRCSAASPTAARSPACRSSRRAPTPSRARPVEDQVTRNYVTLAERVDGNDLRALIALAEGMRLGDADPDPAHPPMQHDPVRDGQRGRDPRAVEAAGGCHAERHVRRAARPAPLQCARLAGVPARPAVEFLAAGA